MNVTPEVIKKVSAFITDKSQSADQVLEILNAPSIPNPGKQGSVKPPMTFAALASVIDAASLGKVITYVHLDEVIADIRRQDYDAAALWVAGLTAAGILTPADAAAIGAAVSASVPDPDWKETLSWAEANLGGSIDAHDLNQVIEYGKWSQ